jgi:hypothetical protein
MKCGTCNMCRKTDAGSCEFRLFPNGFFSRHHLREVRVPGQQPPGRRAAGDRGPAAAVAVRLKPHNPLDVAADAQ